MRDFGSTFTKSILRFSWGMSLFGVQQMVNVLKPDDPSRPFDDVAEEVRDQLGDNLRYAYIAGEQFQGHMVDMVANLCSAEGCQPNRWVNIPNEVVRRASETFKQSFGRRFD